MKILLTAIGKRIQLITHLKRSCQVYGTDCSDLAPAIYFIDKFYRIPRYNQDGYIDRLIEICREEKVDMLIPLYEREYSLLCKNRNRFIEIGTKLLLSSAETIEYCNDKYKTYEFFKAANIDTPRTYIKQELICNFDFLKYPLIIKPIDGMGSSNVYKVYDNKQLEFFMEYVEKPVIQECIEGTEYSIDTLCDLNGKVISIVPRERIEVKGGEVVKSRTVKDFLIIDKTKDLLEELPIIGPGTIQCIKNNSNEIKFIEVNPRFGGGVPLSFEAGIDYGKYFNLMCRGEKITPIIGEFKEITMLRYDEAIFL